MDPKHTKLTQKTLFLGILSKKTLSPTLEPTTEYQTYKEFVLIYNLHGQYISTGSFYNLVASCEKEQEIKTNLIQTKNNRQKKYINLTKKGEESFAEKLAILLSEEITPLNIASIEQCLYLVANNYTKTKRRDLLLKTKLSIDKKKASLGKTNMGDIRLSPNYIFNEKIAHLVKLIKKTENFQ